MRGPGSGRVDLAGLDGALQLGAGDVEHIGLAGLDTCLLQHIEHQQMGAGCEGHANLLAFEISHGRYAFAGDQAFDPAKVLRDRNDRELLGAARHQRQCRNNAGAADIDPTGHEGTHARRRGGEGLPVLVDAHLLQIAFGHREVGGVVAQPGRASVFHGLLGSKAGQRQRAGERGSGAFLDEGTAVEGHFVSLDFLF